MSALKKILGAVIQIGFMALGYYLGGPIGAFIGSLIGAFAAAGVNSLLSGGRGSDPEIGKVNVRVEEPIRWLNAGRLKQGGGALFAEFDGGGNLWYIIVHSDSILVQTLQYYLDSIPVTLDGSGLVLTKDFRLKDNKERDPADSDGEGLGYIQIWTTTYTESDPIPPGIAALTAAIPAWTADEHLLVGTTYSVVKVKAISTEHRYKIYKWRGPIGLGEPAISIAGHWSHAYDPRDVAQLVNDATTYTFTRNPVLIWAWFRTHRYGRNKSRDSINWTKVAEQATICDEVVSGIAGDHVRYQCDIAIPEDKQRAVAEQLILQTMDAQIVYDDDGKCWARAGYYYEPTLRLTRNRDIIAMESIEAQNGESETQGVIVRYTDPDALYGSQPSAPWYNLLYYVEGQANNFAVVDALEIQDHNQAMRIAKAIGMRLQPAWKIVPTVGLRGLKATQERIVNVLYDNTFAGDHEITTQVEIDKSGALCRVGLVPVDEDRWTLLPGEEKAKPVTDTSQTAPEWLPIVGATVAAVNDRLELTFPVPARDDLTYQAQYIPTYAITGDDDDPWLAMTVNGNLAVSGLIEDEIDYTVRYRYVSGSGASYGWQTLAVTGVIGERLTNDSGEILTTGAGEPIVAG